MYKTSRIRPPFCSRTASQYEDFAENANQQQLILLVKRITGNCYHETNFSTKCAQKSQNARLPCPNGYTWRQTGPQATSFQRSSQAFRLAWHLCLQGFVTVPGYSFPRKLRLTEPVQFKAVFNQAKYKVSNRYFLVLAYPNLLEHPRLGLVIGKKNLPLAIQRNRIKRLLRTSFRLNQELLTGLDIVILARSNMTALENQQITEVIQGLWTDLVKKCRSKPHNASQSN